MNLPEHYTNLYESSKREILAGNYTTDNLIDSTHDNRFGITLLLRPNDEVRGNIQAFLDELKQLEPTQYYYPNSDLHVTVMSIISCYDGFSLESIAVKDYVQVIEKSIANMPEMEIEFRGVTASPSAVMVQGFPSKNTLNLLRDSLRENFKNTNLEQSIDKRYTIATAHITVMRFRNELQNTPALVRVLDKYRNHRFGKLTVESVELVYNDWYQREQFVKGLYCFQLGAK